MTLTVNYTVKAGTVPVHPILIPGAARTNILAWLVESWRESTFVKYGCKITKNWGFLSTFAFIIIFNILENMPKDAITHTFYNVKHWLQSLSFRTGVIVLLCCIPFYILSFAQMLLPISVTAKGILWTVLFGLAKTCQYGDLTILGVEGYKRLKDKFKHKN